MPLVTSYLYPNSFTVQIVDNANVAISGTRDRIVYQRPRKIYQGIDNPVSVDFKNQDQKYVDLEGYVVQASIQDPLNQQTIKSYAVNWANIASGKGYFTFDSVTVSNLENRIYKLTFKTTRSSDNVSFPLYSDDNYGVPVDLDILPAYYNQEPFASNITYDGGTITGNV